MNITEIIDEVLRQQPKGQPSQTENISLAASRIVAVLLEDEPWIPVLETRVYRAKLGRSADKLKAAVRKARPAGALLTQREVAQLIGMSERGVRAVERRAFLKLRNHPELKELWRQYISGGPIEEGSWILNPEEIHALFNLARTSEELHLIEKVLWIVQP